MFRSDIAPPLEQMLDFAIEATSIALLPMNLGAWATLAWIRWIEAAARRQGSGSPLDKARDTA